MKVSAVVPVCNVEKYLPQCLNSAVEQTLADMEFLCVDDGSADECGKLLDEYAAADFRFTVIHQRNGGYGVAMNRGLAIARGDYFAVLESDDFVMPDTYETLYDTANRFDADVVRSDYFDYATPDGKDSLTAQKISDDPQWYSRPICPNEEQTVYTFVMHNWTGVYKTAFLSEHGIRYHETPGASYQDNGFFFRVFSHCRTLVYVPRPFYAYRIDNPGSSINNPTKVYAMTDEYAYIRENLQNDGLWEQLKTVYYNRLFRAMNETYRRIAKKYKNEYAAFFRTEMQKAAADGMDEMLFTDRERLLYKTLLRSEREYAIMSGSKNLPIKAVVWVAGNLQCFGFRKTVAGIKRKIVR